MDNNDPLPQMHPSDRLSIPAVLVVDRNGADRAASAAGIHEPVEIPITFGNDPDVLLGDGFTSNLTAIFEPADQDEPWADDGNQQAPTGASDEPASRDD